MRPTWHSNKALLHLVINFNKKGRYCQLGLIKRGTVFTWMGYPTMITAMYTLMILYLNINYLQ